MHQISVVQEKKLVKKVVHKNTKSKKYPQPLFSTEC